MEGVPLLKGLSPIQESGSPSVFSSDKNSLFVFQ
jgi:hypothetical protein